ncbi:hypothetical protein [Roseospirillum parvum]|uniref:Transposase DDE domain-containing protein n=1 Tax=Roseospirillum parvum TaxID=83401 RepID=A0A1G8GJG8_9PROT|nr:hypothetical protein [Roseospirillum parvum]SDH94461.1 hypothetical protein SAMN05421742_1292 [Roseospirillum parvum]
MNHRKPFAWTLERLAGASGWVLGRLAWSTEALAHRMLRWARVINNAAWRADMAALRLARRD